MAVRLTEQRLVTANDGTVATENTGNQLDVTSWVWRPIVQQLLSDGIIEEDRADRLSRSSGEFVPKQTCIVLARALQYALKKHGVFTCDGPMVVNMEDGRTYSREVADKKNMDHVSPYVANADQVQEVIDFLFSVGDGIMIL